jgi:hypothetical protein
MNSPDKVEVAAPDESAPAARLDDLRLDRAPLWEAILGMLAAGVLYAFLPEKLLIGPPWLLLVIEVVFLLPLIVTILFGRGLPRKFIRPLVFTVLGLLTLALASGIVLLIATLPTDKYATNLLRAAALLWCDNVIIFGLWYWQIDGGGPVKRLQSGHQAADFMFPQQSPNNVSGWMPRFPDYLFLAFTGATALSPADTFPLTRPAKMLMMLEAILSMTVIVLLAGRAVNIIGG